MGSKDVLVSLHSVAFSITVAGAPAEEVTSYTWLAHQNEQKVHKYYMVAQTGLAGAYGFHC